MNQPLRIFVGSGRVQRALHGPSRLQAAIEFLLVQPVSGSPISDAQRFTVMCKHSIASMVAVLLCVSCPSDVTWEVTAHIVDAVKSVPRRWTWPNITNEHTEVSPFTADGDASSTVMVKFPVIWVLASVEHRGPSAVFGWVSQSVTRRAGLAQATTTSRVASYQVPSLDDYFTTAIAAAEPLRFTSRRSKFNSDKRTESVADPVDSWWHLDIMDQAA
jgi:hypothetical protein